MPITADTVILFDGADQNPWSDARFAQSNVDSTQLFNARLEQINTLTANIITYIDETAAEVQSAKAAVAFAISADDIDEFGLVVLDDRAGNRYELEFADTTRADLAKYTGGVRTSIGTFSSIIDQSFTMVNGDIWTLAVTFPGVNPEFSLFLNGVQVGTTLTDSDSPHLSGQPGFVCSRGGGSRRIYVTEFGVDGVIASIEEIRKSSTFDIETTLGTITTATLNGVNVFDHVTGQVGTTVSFEGAATDEITTSGEYTLTLGDGVTTQNITVQVNVVGVAPTNNPLQKDGSALASLTGVQVRVTDGANINGTQLYYSGTATTDASGNLGNIDLSSTAAAVDDAVLLHMRTAAGDSIISDETVGLI